MIQPIALCEEKIKKLHCFLAKKDTFFILLSFKTGGLKTHPKKRTWGVFLIKVKVYFIFLNLSKMFEIQSLNSHFIKKLFSAFTLFDNAFSCILDRPNIESKNNMSLISNVRNRNLQQQKNREYVK